MHGSRAMLFPDDDDDYVRKEVGGMELVVEEEEEVEVEEERVGVGSLSKRRVADGGSEV